MAEIGLPKLLERHLRDFCCEIGLSSWRFYGDMSSNVTVVLRFSENQHGLPSSRSNFNQDVRFRRKNKSQMNRDRRRMESFNERKRSVTEQTENLVENMETTTPSTPLSVENNMPDVSASQQALSTSVSLSNASVPIPQCKQGQETEENSGATGGESREEGKISALDYDKIMKGLKGLEAEMDKTRLCLKSDEWNKDRECEGKSEKERLKRIDGGETGDRGDRVTGARSSFSSRGIQRHHTDTVAKNTWRSDHTAERYKQSPFSRRNTKPPDRDYLGS